MPEENGRFSARESEFFEFHSSSILVPRDHDALSLGNIRLGFFTRLLSTPLSLSLSLWIPSSQHLLLRKPHRIRLFFLFGLDLPLCFGSGSSVSFFVYGTHWHSRVSLVHRNWHSEMLLKKRKKLLFYPSCVCTFTYLHSKGFVCSFLSYVFAVRFVMLLSLMLFKLSESVLLLYPTHVLDLLTT